MGVRQTGAVDLAIGRHRELLDDHDYGGCHVDGQLATGLLTNLGCGDLRAARLHPGDQAGLPIVLVAPDDGRSDPRGLANDGLDLSGLDTVTADLDLVIGASKELDRPVDVASPRVAGPVDQLGGVQRAVGRDETLGGQLGAAPVADRQPVPADAQLSGDTEGRQLSVPVEYVDVGVGDGLTQANRSLSDLLNRGPDRGLGGPVHVPQVAATRQQLGS